MSFRSCLILYLCFFGASIHADELKINKNIVVESYLISGSSLENLWKEMDKKGPDGNWGLTHWKIHWTPGCDVSIDITITLPKLVGSGTLSGTDRLIFERMLVALETHENHHARIGTYAAEEIKRYDCKNTDQIAAYWKSVNKRFDLDTKHGQREGVDLARKTKK
ncbi:MAG: DUF922 domain-containing protein [Pseudomonadota bacterium]